MGNPHEELPMVQILAPDGSVTDRDLLRKFWPDGETLHKIYRDMLNMRQLGICGMEEGTRPPNDREPLMTIYISPEGEEAALASVYALKRGDRILYYARSHEVAYARRISIPIIFDLFFGVPNPEIIKISLEKKVDPPYGVVGTNMPLAVGIALAPKIIGEKEPVVATYFGDGATATADFATALNWAARFRTQVLFLCLNNGIAIATPTELQGAVPILQKARGFGLNAIRVDGRDPIAVYAITKKMRAWIEENKRPALIELMVDRRAKHTNRAPGLQLTKEEEAALKKQLDERDAIRRTSTFLLSPSAEELLGIHWTESEDVELRRMTTAYVREEAENSYKRLAEALKNGKGKAIVDRGASLVRSARKVSDADAISKMRVEPEVIENATGGDALRFALYDSTMRDRRVFMLAQDGGALGGVHLITALPTDYIKKHLPDYASMAGHKFFPLQKIAGDKRCIDAPLDERGIVAVATGAAMYGLKPVIEIQFSGFATIACEKIIEAADIYLLHGEELHLVVRLPDGGGNYMAKHRECLVPHFLNTPGLNMVYPSTVQDLYDMLSAAVLTTGEPVLFFEHKELYNNIRGRLVRRPPEKSVKEFGHRIAHKGKNVTIATFGAMVHTAIEAAEAVKADGISVEVIDLRVLSPFNPDMLIESVNKTGRLITAEECPRQGGIGAEIVAAVSESEYTYRPKSQPTRVAAPFGPHPPGAFWKYYTPQKDAIITAIRKSVNTPWLTPTAGSRNLF
ncbi:MAG: hypothetical protein HYW89_02760 [Candidatus Sungiibacteriota bacterium]|uniref:Transketolase-like pyrimidine-binding domain-containing protein n=1 Tax=Candidatus Sungiibacteriota bacterium TaxID=2750080 RepID=A0A7T5UQ82_9BACT|nr:MAG: hypothetical protein HYW89_02760 [Candidatus Sungbacteria bacterium]